MIGKHPWSFEDFNLTEKHSTLLVQAVDHWHSDAAQLLEPFRFIPNWVSMIYNRHLPRVVAWVRI